MWLSDVDRANGYAVDFLSLSLHAVSRDPEAYPSPCIYTQVFLLFLFLLFVSMYIGMPYCMNYCLLVYLSVETNLHFKFVFYCYFTLENDWAPLIYFFKLV